MKLLNNNKGKGIPSAGWIGIALMILFFLAQQRSNYVPSQAGESGLAPTTVFMTTTTLGNVRCAESYPNCNGYCDNWGDSCQRRGSRCYCVPEETTTIPPQITTTTQRVTTTLQLRRACSDIIFAKSQANCDLGSCDRGYYCKFSKSFGSLYGSCSCVRATTTTSIATTTTVQYTTTTAVGSCYDSDGGNYPNTAGYIIYNSIYKDDYCSGSYAIQEYSCLYNPVNFMLGYHSCPNGCEYITYAGRNVARCISTPPTTTTTIPPDCRTVCLQGGYIAEYNEPISSSQCDAQASSRCSWLDDGTVVKGYTNGCCCIQCCSDFVPGYYGYTDYKYGISTFAEGDAIARADCGNNDFSRNMLYLICYVWKCN